MSTWARRNGFPALFFLIAVVAAVQEAWGNAAMLTACAFFIVLSDISTDLHNIANQSRDGGESHG